jgi:hypothetical protein
MALLYPDGRVVLEFDREFKSVDDFIAYCRQKDQRSA